MHKTLLPEMPWVHSDAQDAFALFLQFSRDKMNDHVEEGSVEEEDEGSDSIFFERLLLGLRGSACIGLVTDMIQCACQSELIHHPFL